MHGRRLPLRGLPVAPMKRHNQFAGVAVAAIMALSVPTPAGAESWRYDENATPIGGTSREATVLSGEPVTFSFPYGGPHYGQLTVRNDPRWGVDVFFAIQKGHILCDDYNNATVAIRFDQEKPTLVECNDAADSSTNVTFLEKERWLIDKLVKARTVTLGVTFYQEGTRYFTFEVAGLDLSKLKLAQATKKRK